MPELQLVRSEHGPAILAFELENRGYFAEWISDRGDEYFQQFNERHNELLADQNLASQRVLIKAGFVPAETADPADIGGKQGRWYRRYLTATDPDHSIQPAT